VSNLAAAVGYFTLAALAFVLVAQFILRKLGVK
jgi:hypothetical protein